MSVFENATGLTNAEPDSLPLLWSATRPRSWIRTAVIGGAFVGCVMFTAACEAPDATAEDVAITAEWEAKSTTAGTNDPINLVNDCVDQTKARAFGGDTFWREHWNNLGHDEVQLRQWCEQFGNDDPAALAGLSRDWQLSLAAVPAETIPAPQPLLEQPSDDCNGNYSGCVPNATDVDCAGGDGDGPAYVDGPVQVLGDDVYGLDYNHDGWGCETG